jgi:hypothetical protein
MLSEASQGARIREASERLEKLPGGCLRTLDVVDHQESLEQQDENLTRQLDD